MKTVEEIKEYLEEELRQAEDLLALDPYDFDLHESAHDAYEKILNFIEGKDEPEA